MEFLGKNAKVVPDDVGLSVHIIMDRSSVSQAVPLKHISTEHHDFTGKNDGCFC